MEFLETIQNCLQIFGIFIRFLDFSIRVLFEIFAKVYEIFSSDTPLETQGRYEQDPVSFDTVQIKFAMIVILNRKRMVVLSAFVYFMTSYQSCFPLTQKRIRKICLASAVHLFKYLAHALTELFSG